MDLRSEEESDIRLHRIRPVDGIISGYALKYMGEVVMILVSTLVKS